MTVNLPTPNRVQIADQPRPSLRVLFAGERWPGSDAYAYERAFRRAGHSVTAIEAGNILPSGWRSTWLRALRRGLEPWLVAEYERALIDTATELKPLLFVGFKAPYVTAKAMTAIKATGAITINIYPDVSVMAHGRYLPQALPLYDWIFTTKTFGLGDMKRQLGLGNASFIPPAFDPEIHRQIGLDDADVQRYRADVSFIGTFQPKTEKYLAAIREGLPDVKLKVWGNQWEPVRRGFLGDAIQLRAVTGIEYAKCIQASRINLAPLRDRQRGASSGDLITQRTFGMPACGGFMLHERTTEIHDYFLEGSECALFSDETELVTKVRHYLGHEQERLAIAEAGRARALASGYSVDARLTEVLEKYDEIRMARNLGSSQEPVPVAVALRGKQVQTDAAS